MAVETTLVEYEFNGETFEGALCMDSGLTTPTPAVLVSHAWAGRTDVEIGMAQKLAALGYVGFAHDLYGKGKFGTTTEECQALMNPLASDRAGLQARLNNILNVVKERPEVDPAQVAAIGFCFGGLCVLDMARAGMDVKGVASFHGLFAAPDNIDNPSIDAKVIAFHGFDDPMAKPDDMVAFAHEMTKANADWQIHAYGGTMHAFTNPNANDPAFGTVYNETAAARSWGALEDFLAECFAD